MSTDSVRINDKLCLIQAKLKAPKGQTNKFGGYKYRSCEDIVEAAKPLCAEQGLTLQLTDVVVEVGGRVYVKASARVSDGNEAIHSDGWAREEETKKGMDAAQITGAASSYARKYALNGLFAIDDTKDADATNEHGKTNGAAATKPPAGKGSAGGKKDNQSSEPVDDDFVTKFSKQCVAAKSVDKLKPHGKLLTNEFNAGTINEATCRKCSELYKARMVVLETEAVGA